MKISPLYTIFAKALFVALATYFFCILTVVVIEESLRLLYLTAQIYSHYNPWFTNIIAAFAGWLFFIYTFPIILPHEKLDLRLSEIKSHLSQGICAGISIKSLSAFILYHLDQVIITKSIFRTSDIAVFSVTITPLFEEILFRGVIQRYLTACCSPIIGITLAALAFGFVHISNENATIWSCLNIAAGSGVLFGLLYYATNNLWSAVGAHAGWNLAEGIIWGSPNSGAHIPGFLEMRPIGHPILSGGAFGLEASIVVTAICMFCSFLIVRRLNHYVFSNRSRAARRNDAI